MIKQLNQLPVMNPTFEATEVDSTDTHATIVIEPLEQGYGHTLGNALRRVLLSSLPGHAITSVRIDGVEHEYTALEGLTEDILELILNIKQIRIKADTIDPITLKFSAKGEGEVTAAAITLDLGAEIINKDLVLANLAKGGSLEVEMKAEFGIGYAMASDAEETVIGEIPVDALYSPVVKVSYKVESTRVGRRTDFDKVVMHIQTDGTVSPLEAVKRAAKILARQFTQVFEPVLPVVEEEEVSLSPEEAENLRLTVEELDLPTRIANALRKGGFKTVGDLQGAPKMTIAKVKNLGEKSVDVIQEALDKKGVLLGE
jgi:DNA-directed RNA polymerase subunit alpha